MFLRRSHRPRGGEAVSGSRPAPRRRPAFPLVVLALAVFLVYLGAGNADRAIRAARADGEPGRFTAAAAQCVSHLGHQSCTCHGDYRSDDGTVEMAGVFLAGGDGTCEAGTRSAAVDIGSTTRVYHPDGSNEWAATAGLVLLGAGMATWAVIALVRVRPK